MSLNTHCQISQSDEKVLKTELLRKINDLRKSVGAEILVLDERLATAADVQSYYMSEKDILTHFQTNPKFNTPKKRIEHFSPLQFDIYGENVLLSKKHRFPLTKNSSIRIADEMFVSWKNSPEHYQNMVETEFDATNFGFKVNKGGQIYATNVFGRTGIKIDNQLSIDQFGLTDDTEGDCFDEFASYDNILVNIGNGIAIEGEKIVLYYHDISYFQMLFPGSNDGIAIDLIDVDQLACNKKNSLDISPIHDGILTRPVYSNEILKNNRAESDYRLISTVGTIPDHLQGKDLTFTVLLIKDGTVCQKVIPTYVPSSSYPLKPLHVKLEKPKKNFQENVPYLKSITVPYEFHANKTVPLEIPKIPIKNQEIVAIKIKSFSSIEGNEQKNKILHNQRAEAIKKHLLHSLEVSADIFEIETKENWAKFQYQLKYLFLDSLVNRSPDELRKLASNRQKSDIPWDAMLFEQRKSIATIYYTVDQPPNITQDEEELSKLRYSLLQNDLELTKRALFEIYQHDSRSHEELFEESIFTSLTEEIELVQNMSAVLTKYSNSYADETVTYLNKWLTSQETLDVEARFNLLYLYSLVYSKLLNKWDVPSQSLANVINPKYAQQTLTDISSNELMLNLHLTFIKYYGQINDSENISKSFKFISSYFLTRALSAEDVIALSKFYNRWSMFQLTTKYLLTKFDDEELDEDAIFLLLKTLNYYNVENDLSDYEEVFQKALNLNQSRWCNWVSGNIQLLREIKIKKIYCSSCN